MGWISRWIPRWLKKPEVIQEQRPKPYGSNNHLNAPTPPTRASFPVPPGPYSSTSKYPTEGYSSTSKDHPPRDAGR